MGLTLAVGSTLHDLGNASAFARFLNWVAAQNDAAARYPQVMAVRPVECEYAGADLAALERELADLSRHAPNGETSDIVVEWLEMVRVAIREREPLEFV